MLTSFSFAGVQLAGEALHKVSDKMPYDTYQHPPPSSKPPPQQQQPNRGGLFPSIPEFRAGRKERSIKKFADQDYNDLKRRAKSRGVLFEDPEFPASNRLLVDDQNQYIVSYFGRFGYDANQIEWLRPHVSIVKTEAKK